MKTKIFKIGFEIEGEWSDSASQEIQRFGQIGSDGSIKVCEYLSSKHPMSHSLYLAEFRSRPFKYKRDVRRSAKKLFELLQDRYKNGEFHWNDSMGFHVHVSFNNGKPPEVFSGQFMEAFLKSMKEKFPEVWRVRKDNTRYCSPSWSLNEIARPSSRYKAVNYAAFQKHGTVEFRIYGADEPKKMYEELLFTMEFIENFISSPLIEKHEVEFPETETRNMELDIPKEMKEINLGEFVARQYNHSIDVSVNGRKLNKYI